MKKQSILAMMLLSSFGMMITKEDATAKVTKIKPLKTGEKLHLSEFTKRPDGIMYKIIKKGSGAKACPGEKVTVHYTGYFLEQGTKVGKKFDSSVDRDTPFSFKLGVGQVIKGWDIMVAEMEIGESVIVILPSNFAYGFRGTPGIPGDSTLIFEITVLKAS